MQIWLGGVEINWKEIYDERLITAEEAAKKLNQDIELQLDMLVENQKIL